MTTTYYYDYDNYIFRHKKPKVIFKHHDVSIVLNSKTSRFKDFFNNFPTLY